MKAGTVELTIERIVAGGYGLARTDEGVVLVRGAMPGERVTARPAVREGVLRAHAIDILDANPHRVALALPPGADLPLAYPEQLKIKTDLVVEALRRIAKIDLALEPIVPSPRELGYRTAAQYAVRPEGLGARAIGSDRVIALDADPLVCEPIARAFAACLQRSLVGVDEVSFRASLAADAVIAGIHAPKRGQAERAARLLLDSGVAGVVWAEPDVKGRFRGRSESLGGITDLIEDFGGIRASVAVDGFAQVNPAAAGALYIEAAERAGSGGRVIELYAGTGILGAHMAARHDEVVAIEIDGGAVRRGSMDARRLGLANMSFHRGDARTVSRYGAARVIAVDPPRAGMEPAVIASIAAAKPEQIVSISCDPSTWARDAARLQERGYDLTFARPYDFYPFTHHVEVLSLFVRR